MVSTALRSGRSVVVTNAGAGLGRDVALGLASKGYIVFGTAAFAEEVSDLRNASGGRVSLTVCDISNAMSVEAWAGGVTDALGRAGLQPPNQRCPHPHARSGRDPSARRHPA